MLHKVCTQLYLDHLSICDGDSSQCSGEIVEISNCAFQCLFFLNAQSADVIKVKVQNRIMDNEHYYDNNK